MIKVNSTLDFVSELFLSSRPVYLSIPRPRSRATILSAVDVEFLMLIDEKKRKPILATPRILK